MGPAFWRILVKWGQAVQEEIFLGMPDPEGGGTPWSEKSQTDYYMILKMLGQWNSLKYQDSSFTLIYREVSAVYESH
jgi:hypothetical protein